MKNYITILFTLLISASSYANPACVSFFKQDLDKKLDSKKYKFDLDYFYEVKQRLAKEDASSLDLTRPEVKLAIFETQAQVSKYGLDSIETIMQNGTAKQKKQIVKAFSKIQLHSKSKPLDFQSALIHLYRIANSHPRNLIKTLTEDLSVLEKRMIRERIELEILRTDLLSALENLGLLKKRSSLDKVRLWLNRNPNVSALTTSAYINYFTQYWFSIWGDIPAAQMIYFQRIKPALIQKVREQGFESVYPDLLKVFKNKVRLDITFHAVARSFSFYILLNLTHTLHENLNLIKFGISMMTVSEQSLKEYEETHFNAAQIRQERFKSWKEGYEAFNGPLEDPNLTNDVLEENRELVRKKREQLEQIPDDELRVFQ